MEYCYCHWITCWHIWLRHCATYWKVAGLVHNYFILIFHVHNISGRTLALGLTQPLTEMSSRNISWAKAGLFVILITLPLSFVDCLQICEPQPPGTLRTCTVL